MDATQPGTPAATPATDGAAFGKHCMSGCLTTRGPCSCLCKLAAACCACCATACKLDLRSHATHNCNCCNKEFLPILHGSNIQKQQRPMIQCQSVGPVSLDQIWHDLLSKVTNLLCPLSINTPQHAAHICGNSDVPANQPNAALQPKYSQALYGPCALSVSFL